MVVGFCNTRLIKPVYTNIISIIDSSVKHVHDFCSITVSYVYGVLKCNYILHNVNNFSTEKSYSSTIHKPSLVTPQHPLLIYRYPLVLHC